MPCVVIFGKHFISDLDCTDVLSLKREISQKHGVPVEDLLATLNGRLVSDDYDIRTSNNVVRLSTKLVGGKVIFGKHFISDLDCTDVLSLKREISQKHGVPVEDLLATLNGRLVSDDYDIRTSNNVVRLSSKLVGGKGGFGSMLRAIGSQIEKTTNRESCRDLSGRRLRDINEEKRLRKWLEGQEEREKEAAERKQKKFERLVAEPKIEVNLNPSYEKERQDLPERVSSAVEAGWQAAGSSNTLKRKSDSDKAKPKKAKLWIDADLSDCSSLSEDEEDDEKTSSPGQQVSTDSGNESDKASTSSE
ncbi:unnamed protein product [Spodoptera littoralis]|uniref:SDE2-like domain-containing protein n=1 Tax=Spodoptera littoralis TaxID=7109 RepID=A0A9P0I6F1_SPOLI|nr:unnamed protein product [Spodoptera littoralis]CAH1640866.1 unnamed protein product [Spodoptera littoralis]